MNHINYDDDVTVNSTLLTPAKKRLKPQQKSLILYAFLVFTLYSNLPSYLPNYVIKYHPLISSTKVSIILSIYELGAILTILMNTKILTCLSKHQAMILGFLLLIISSILQSFSPFIHFFEFMLIGRFIGGVGDACVMTNCYIYAMEQINFNKLIGFMEAGQGIGFIIGPVLGSFLFSISNFEITQLSMAFFPLLGFIVVYFTSKKQKQTLQPDLQISLIIMDKESWFAFICTTISVFGYTFSGSFMAITLNQTYRMNQYQIGLLFLCQMIPDMIANLIMPSILTNFPRKIILSFSILMLAIASALMGPCQYLFLPQKLYIVCVGFMINGFFASNIFNFVLPEVLEKVTLRLKIQMNVQYTQDTEDAINNKISQYYAIFYSLSALISPFIGGLMYDYTNHQTSYNISMFIILLYFIIYTIFNVNKNVFKENKKFQQDYEQLFETRSQSESSI